MNADILQKFNVTVTGESRQMIVLAHGFGSDQTAWRYQIEVLKSRDRLVRFDDLGWTNGFVPLATANSGRREIGRAFAGSLSAVRPDIAQFAARVIFEADYRFLLNTIQQPVFILRSQRDIVVPMEAAYYLADQLPHSKLTLLNAEDHLPHLRSPDEVTKAIWEFASDDAA